jgi:hypothetical protein
MYRFTILLLSLLASSLSAGELPSLADFRPETIRGQAGYFRVGQSSAGQWWLITPDDRAFFSKGVTAINRAGTMGGRWAKRGPYADAIDAKFGTADPEPFVSDVLRRLREWEINTMAAWTTVEFFDRGVPYTEVLEFRKISSHAFRVGAANLPDVFDPRWIEACDKWAAALCPPRRQSRDLIGYFTDNELGWAQPRAESLFAQVQLESTAKAPERPSLLQICLGLDPEFAARQAAWQFVLARHRDLAGLSRAWEVDLPDEGAFARFTAADTALLSPGYLEDNRAFSADFARRYFRITSEAIRRHDPNHLILGCRFGGPPGQVILEACVAPEVDVLSANNYRDTFFERLDEYYRANAMPILVGEFAWASDYFVKRPMPDEPAGFSERDRMQSKGRAALEKAITHPGLVGYAWYRWVQGDPAKIPPYSYGLVYINDETAHEHVDVLREINARAEQIRLSGATR